MEILVIEFEQVATLACTCSQKQSCRIQLKTAPTMFACVQLATTLRVVSKAKDPEVTQSLKQV